MLLQDKKDADADADVKACQPSKLMHPTVVSKADYKLQSVPLSKLAKGTKPASHLKL